jgi:hypothetical protein
MARKAIELPPVTLSEEDGVRYLHLGTIWIQGGMRMAKPQVVEIDYVQRMLASLLWLPSSDTGQGQAVQLGLGAGAITRFTAVQLKMATTVVEINPQVVAVNVAYFTCPLGPRWCRATRPTGWPRPTGQRAPAARGPVRPRSRRAGAGRCGLLPRLPRGAGRRRADERQFVRPPRQLP